MASDDSERKLAQGGVKPRVQRALQGRVVSPAGALIVEKAFELSKERAEQLVIQVQIPARVPA